MSERFKKGIRNANVQPTFDLVDRVKGTTLYNFNQHFVEVESEDGTKSKENEYDSLLIDYPVNANHILETLIYEKYPSGIEQKLINDYNAAVAGIEEKAKKQPYLDFLNDRKALRAMVDADCIANNIQLN
jgi:hypothetical protein